MQGSRRHLRFSGLIVAALFCGGVSAAGEPPCARQGIKAVVRADLVFGKFAVFGSGGVGVLSAGGARTVSGGLEPLGGLFHPSAVLLSGTPGARFLISTEPGAVLRARHGATLVAKHVVSDPPVFGRFDERGLAELRFGAELRVPPAARDGEYVAEVAFTATYLEDK